MAFELAQGRSFKAPAHSGHYDERDPASDGDPPASVCDRSAVEGEPSTAPRLDAAESASLVIGRDPPVSHDPCPAGDYVCEVRVRQWTILAIGSSIMSVAPRSFSAGMSTLISDLGTTASTA